MKIMVYSVTPNDDYETPFARVFGSVDGCLEFIFDRLDIGAEDRKELLRLFDEGENLEEALTKFKENDYDTYSLNSHSVEIPHI